VKPAYKVSVDIISTEHGPSSGGTVHCPTIDSAFPWGKIWLMRVPNKVKHALYLSLGP
jgi:hypothetical protein